MRANDTSRPKAYLATALAGGMRPFRYRRGIHRLLGLPDQGGRAVTVLPPLPPVGFQYERHRGLGRPWPPSPLQVPPSEHRRGRPVGEAEFDGEMHAVIREETPAERTETTSPVMGMPSPEKTPFRNRTAPLEAEPEGGPSTSASTGQKEHATGEQALELGQSDRVVREATQHMLQEATPPAAPPRLSATAEPVTPGPARLEIPGITQRRELFAALAHHVSTRDSAGGVPSAGRSGPHARADAEARSSVLTGSMRARGTNLQHHAGLDDAPPEETALQTEAAPPHDESPVADPMLDARSAVRTMPASVFRTGGQTGGEIEHVRRAVAQLAARQEASPDTPPREPPSSPPAATPPVSPPPMIVQRVAGPPRRVPRAFWASSMLRSTHLRILR